jgi:hypothetical protein
VALLLAASAVAACGKKGAPLPPILRVPGPVGELSATRIGDDVFVRFTVPVANIGGEKPADVARVEVYAITADREPSVLDDPEDLRELSTLVATEQVRKPIPPPPPRKAGDPEPPPLPLLPGLDQGTIVVAREQLTPAMRTPVALPERNQPRRDDEDEIEILPGPLVAPIDSNDPKRYYYAVGVSPNGRYGPAQPFFPVPLGATSSAPSAPTLSYDEKLLTMKWTPPPDVRGLPIETAPAESKVLPSRSLVPEVPRTMYDVYEEIRPAPANATPLVPTEPAPIPLNGTPALPVPLTLGPIGELEFTQPVTTLGIERCFFIRTVDIVDGYHVRGPAGPTACIELKDTFPPAAPASLAAVASAGAINLIWDPSADADLAGYLVLRGEGPGATLTPLTEEPVDKTAFIDNNVRPGVTYTYVVVALDKAGNRSPESNRVEETARQ